MPSKYISDVGRNNGNYKFGGGKNNIYLTDSSQSDLNTVTYDGVDYRVGYVINSGGGDDIIQGAGGKDCLIGGAGADYLRGLGGDDVIDGGAGNDILGGDGGADLIIAGDGDDLIFIESGSDTISGGAGADSFVFEEAIATLGVKTITDFTPGVDSLEFFMAFYPGLSLSCSNSDLI